MKFLERIALFLFSIVMIILAVTNLLIVFNVIELETLVKYIEEILKYDIACKIIIGTSIVAVILAIKSIFFPSRIKKKQEIKSGVLLENKDGRLLISKDTIENIVNSVVKSYDDAVDGQTKVVLDSNNQVTVFVSLLVKNNSIIKDMSSSMQIRIKETLKRNTDLDVNQVNINIKDVDNKNIQKVNQAKIKVNSVQFDKQDKEKAQVNIIQNANENVVDEDGQNDETVNNEKQYNKISVE